MVLIERRLLNNSCMLKWFYKIGIAETSGLIVGERVVVTKIPNLDVKKSCLFFLNFLSNELLKLKGKKPSMISYTLAIETIQLLTEIQINKLFLSQFPCTNIYIKYYKLRFMRTGIFYLFVCWYGVPKIVSGTYYAFNKYLSNKYVYIYVFYCEHMESCDIVGRDAEV